MEYEIKIKFNTDNESFNECPEHEIGKLADILKGKLEDLIIYDKVNQIYSNEQKLYDLNGNVIGMISALKY